jgi:hypothetical protein
VEPEDVVDVLSNAISGLAPGGRALDLQVIRPDPVVEHGGVVICAINGTPLFRRADAAVAAVDALVGGRVLIEEAADDHDVRSWYESSTALVGDFAPKERRIAPADRERLQGLPGACAVVERCRLRRLLLA